MLGSACIFVVFALLLPQWTYGAKNRVYYIAIREEVWDYAPSGKNLVTGVDLQDDPEASVFTTNSADRIGRRYTKAIYRQYTDDTYETEVPKDPTLGLLGPTLIAEVGDNITIYARNFASNEYSLHPHGVFYDKQHEGALYTDKTSGKDKEDDKIEPGGSHSYVWEIRPSYGPTEDDPACITWAYHSHTDATRDMYSGLFGALIVCRPGTLDSNGKRTDVDRYYVLAFLVVDENLSWYLDKNIETYCTDDVDKDDDDFVESNLMHAINGYLYGNLQGLTACQGETVAWNIFGMGTEVDIHSVRFTRQTVISEGHREDTINLFPAVFGSVQMQADNPGTALIQCMVNDHYTAGMYANFTVNDTCTGPSNPTSSANATKEFFIGIVEQEWNYGPSGKNLMTGQDLTADNTDSKTFFETAANRIGGTYKKALFVQYENETFVTELPVDPTFGLLGPLIAIEVGDIVDVTLKNFNSTQAYNIEPHGLMYSDTSPVGKGETHTFRWVVPDTVAPTSLDSDCITYLYTSSVDPVQDTNSGLVGPMLVCKRGTLQSALRRPMYFLLFTVFDENHSHYIDENIAKYVMSPVSKEDEDFEESNLMHSINGLMYGNLLGIEPCANTETDIHVIGLGTEVDMHSMFMSGVNYRVRNENTAVVSVFPQTTSSMTINPDQTGNGTMTCMVADHLLGGMLTSYQVKDCGAPASSASSGIERTYYIAAVEENYDFNPSGVDFLGNSVNNPDSPGYVFAHHEDGEYIGSQYRKALYYEYTDGTFTTRIEKPVNLGMLGPVIRGEEGDNITVVFKNLASRPYSIGPWGVFDLDNQYRPGAAAAQAGQTVTYHWHVPSSAVPLADQPACQSWLYMSNVDQIKDMYSGLVGPIQVCIKGTLTSEGTATGVDNEFYLLFLVVDENMSHYLDDNIRGILGEDPATFDKEDDDFIESNLMHGINGQIYGLAGLQMNLSDTVLWHLIGLGNEVDIHTVHFHAHAYIHKTDVTTHNDVFKLFPGKIGTVKMIVDAPGEWLMHCHVEDHVQAGMVTTYKVDVPGGSSGRSASSMLVLLFSLFMCRVFV